MGKPRFYAQFLKHRIFYVDTRWSSGSKLMSRGGVAGGVVYVLGAA